MRIKRREPGACRPPRAAPPPPRFVPAPNARTRPAGVRLRLRARQTGFAGVAGRFFGNGSFETGIADGGAKGGVRPSFRKTAAGGFRRFAVRPGASCGKRGGETPHAEFGASPRQAVQRIPRRRSLFAIPALAMVERGLTLRPSARGVVRPRQRLLPASLRPGRTCVAPVAGVAPTLPDEARRTQPLVPPGEGRSSANRARAARRLSCRESCAACANGSCA